MAEFFSHRINERFQFPRNAGDLPSANAAGTGASFVCGSFVRMFLEIEISTKIIKKAQFKTDGCGYAVAAADVLTEIVAGRQTTELHGLADADLSAEIEKRLGKFSAHRAHCPQLAIRALHNAFAAFRAGQIAEYAGETALICTCFGVSEDTLETIIAENRVVTVADVTRICRAGGGCGACQPLIQDIIDARADGEI